MKKSENAVIAITVSEEVNQRHAEIAKTAKLGKNANAKQQVYVRYLGAIKDGQITLKKLKGSEAIKDSTLKAWASRWNRGLKIPVFRAEKKEEVKKAESKS